MLQRPRRPPERPFIESGVPHLGAQDPMRRIAEDRDRPQDDRDRLVDQVGDQSSHPRSEDAGTRHDPIEVDPRGRVLRLFLRGDGHLVSRLSIDIVAIPGSFTR